VFIDGTPTLTDAVPDGELDDASLVRCPSCDAAELSGDRFCTRCGAALHPDVDGTPSDGRRAPTGAEEDARSHAGGAGAHGSSAHAAGWVANRWGWVALTAALVGVVTLGSLWRLEASRHDGTRETLRATRLEVAELTGVRDRLGELLAAERQLSERRAAVLRRTRAVLSSVDPLLSSVDEMQLMTGKIQDARNDFADSTATLVGDLVTLGNYLIDAGEFADPSYVNGLVDDINDELATVRSQSESLAAYDTRYYASSDRFERRATALADAVRKLNAQLATLAK
jgi:hypothetical protein